MLTRHSSLTIVCGTLTAVLCIFGSFAAPLGAAPELQVTVNSSLESIQPPNELAAKPGRPHDHQHGH
ncbi:hypothetical protein ACFL34_02405 [Candidatus Sumerlaeota bacterium]